MDDEALERYATYREYIATHEHPISIAEKEASTFRYIRVIDLTYTF